MLLREMGWIAHESHPRSLMKCDKHTSVSNTDYSPTQTIDATLEGKITWVAGVACSIRSTTENSDNRLCPAIFLLGSFLDENQIRLGGVFVMCVTFKENIL